MVVMMDILRQDAAGQLATAMLTAYCKKNCPEWRGPYLPLLIAPPMLITFVTGGGALNEFW